MRPKGTVTINWETAGTARAGEARPELGVIYLWVRGKWAGEWGAT